MQADHWCLTSACPVATDSPLSRLCLEVERDDDRGRRPRCGSMKNRLDVVAVRIEHECSVIAWVIGPLARCAVVAASSGDSGPVEPVD